MRFSNICKLLQGFIRDTVRKDSKIKLDESKPLYIIEFGAGPGKFTFHLLHVKTKIFLYHEHYK